MPKWPDFVDLKNAVTLRYNKLAKFPIFGHFKVHLIFEYFLTKNVDFKRRMGPIFLKLQKNGY